MTRLGSVAGRVLGPALMALALSACGGDKRLANDICDEPQEYQEARSVPPVRIPEGLDPLDRSGRLEIPQEDEAGKYPDGRPCLEQPPDYFGR